MSTSSNEAGFSSSDVETVDAADGSYIATTSSSMETGSGVEPLVKLRFRGMDFSDEEDERLLVVERCMAMS